MTLTEAVAVNIVNTYNNLAAAQVFCRALVAEHFDPQKEREVKPMFVNIAASCGNAMDRIRYKIPKEDRKFFDEQVTNNDPLKFVNILYLYSKMQPEVQEQFERIGEMLAKGQIIEFVD